MVVDVDVDVVVVDVDIDVDILFLAILLADVLLVAAVLAIRLVVED